MAAWLVLASAASAYLAVLLLRPELLAFSFGPETASEQDSNDGQRPASQALAEIKTLRHVVGEVQNEVDDLKESMAARIARENVVASRLAALEERAAGPVVGETPVLKSQPAAEARPLPKGAVARPPGRDAGPSNDARSTPEPHNTPAKSAALGQAIETASITPEQPVLKSGVPADDEIPFATRLPAVQIPFGIRLASAPSLEGLRVNWRSLLERHGAVLKPLSAHYLPPSAGEDTYQLIAGPVATADQAKNICATLRARDVACSLIVFGGEAM
jgi:hypothetical protein